MKSLAEIKQGCKNCELHKGVVNWVLEGDLCPTCQALLEQAQEFEKKIEELKSKIGLDNEDRFMISKEITYRLIDKTFSNDVEVNSQTEGNSSKRERALEVNRTSLDNSEKELSKPFSKSDGSPKEKEYIYAGIPLPKPREDVCICGHHTKDHSYNPNIDDANLECDICSCREFKSKKDICLGVGE